MAARSVAVKARRHLDCMKPFAEGDVLGLDVVAVLGVHGDADDGVADKEMAGIVTHPGCAFIGGKPPSRGPLFLGNSVFVTGGSGGAQASQGGGGKGAGDHGGFACRPESLGGIAVGHGGGHGRIGRSVLGGVAGSSKFGGQVLYSLRRAAFDGGAGVWGVVGCFVAVGFRGGLRLCRGRCCSRFWPPCGGAAVTAGGAQAHEARTNLQQQQLRQPLQQQEEGPAEDDVVQFSGGRRQQAAGAQAPRQEVEEARGAQATRRARKGQRGRSCGSAPAVHERCKVTEGCRGGGNLPIPTRREMPIELGRVSASRGICSRHQPLDRRRPDACAPARHAQAAAAD